MLNNYFLIAIYALVSLTITLVLFIIAYVLAPKRKTFEKNSAYECGFEPFDDARSSFDIQFFTVGILFIIFDLELAFLYPWAKVLGSLGIIGFFNALAFFYLLTFGFYFEWMRGALTWSKK